MTIDQARLSRELDELAAFTDASVFASIVFAARKFVPKTAVLERACVLRFTKHTVMFVFNFL